MQQLRTKRFAMTALSKFLALLVIFLSTSFGNTFVYHTRLNHLIPFDALTNNPTNDPSRVPSSKSTSDQMNDQTTNQRLKWDAELPNILSPKRGKYSAIAISTTQNTSNTTYTFEAVNGVNHDHDKIKVDNRVTFEDNRDDEIQCGSREQSRTRTIWQGPKQQSFI